MHSSTHPIRTALKAIRWTSLMAPPALALAALMFLAPAVEEATAANMGGNRGSMNRGFGAARSFNTRPAATSMPSRKFGAASRQNTASTVSNRGTKFGSNVPRKTFNSAPAGRNRFATNGTPAAKATPRPNTNMMTPGTGRPSSPAGTSTKTPGKTIPIGPTATGGSGKYPPGTGSSTTTPPPGGRTTDGGRAPTTPYTPGGRTTDGGRTPTTPYTPPGGTKPTDGGRTPTTPYTPGGTRTTDGGRTPTTPYTPPGGTRTDPSHNPTTPYTPPGNRTTDPGRIPNTPTTPPTRTGDNYPPSNDRPNHNPPNNYPPAIPGTHNPGTMPPGTRTGDYPPMIPSIPSRDPRLPRLPRPPVVVDGGGPMLPPVMLPPVMLPPMSPPAVVVQGSSPGPSLAALPPPPPNRPAANRPPPAAQPPAPPPIRRGGGVPPANEQRYVPNEVVVQVAANLPNQGLTALALRHRLLQLQSFPFLPGSTLVRFRIPDPNQRSVPQVITELENDPVVLTADPNHIYQLSQDRDDPGANAYAAAYTDPTQYALAKMHLAQAHEFALGERVLVAVIDSGVDLTHPAMAGMIFDHIDTIDSDPKPHFHGTGIAGAIVARGKMLGTAPGARVLAVRAFGGRNGAVQSTSVSIAQGILWAVKRGARVVNMSFAGPLDRNVASVLADQTKTGVIFVAAAGNEGPRAAPAFPGNDPNVIAVSGTDPDDNLFMASNRGKHIAVAAPGVGIFMPAPGGTYQVKDGTSFSAALVSGTVALMLQLQPNLDPAAVKRILMATARDLGPPGFDEMFGAGLVDAYAALMSLQPAMVDNGVRFIPASVPR